MQCFSVCCIMVDSCDKSLITRVIKSDSSRILGSYHRTYQIRNRRRYQRLITCRRKSRRYRRRGTSRIAMEAFPRADTNQRRVRRLLLRMLDRRYLIKRLRPFNIIVITTIIPTGEGSALVPWRRRYLMYTFITLPRQNCNLWRTPTVTSTVIRIQ